jgi:phage-related minor tail protein
MKFKYIKPNQTNSHAYTIQGGMKTGDIIELKGHLADKAMRNPDFEKVGNNSKITITPEQGKKAREKFDEQVSRLKHDLNHKIAELQKQIRELQQQGVEREEEGISVDDVFLDDSPLDEV